MVGRRGQENKGRRLGEDDKEKEERGTRKKKVLLTWKVDLFSSYGNFLPH